MNNLLTSISTNIEIFARSMGLVFWEIAEEAEQARARLRLQKELARLAERETVQYRRLGRAGFELLHDHLPVERTPNVLLALADIDRLRGEAHQVRRRPDAKYLETPTPFPWHRLQGVLASGEWVIHSQAIPDSSPWCGRAMIGRPAAGVCLALKRGYSIHPMTLDTVCVSGDTVIILSPVGSVASWSRWILEGSTGSANP